MIKLDPMLMLMDIAFPYKQAINYCNCQLNLNPLTFNFYYLLKEIFKTREFANA